MLTLLATLEFLALLWKLETVFQSIFVFPDSRFHCTLPIDRDGEENRPIIITYGGVNIRNLRGNVSPPTKLVKKAVFRFAKQRNRPALTFAVIVNEYLTPQICPLCHKRATGNAKDTYGQKIYPVLKCTNCGTRYNCDHMASCNMHEVFPDMAKNKYKEY